jgi:hypothetical protein
MNAVLTTVENRARSAATGVYEYFVLGARATRFIAARPFYWRDVIVQMDRIGVGSIPIVLLTGMFTGMVLALQSSVELNKFGADIYIGRLVGASMIRELGPVLCALMIAGRAGSGIAAELGSMKVTEQIDALQSRCVDHGADTYRYCGYRRDPGRIDHRGVARRPACCGIHAWCLRLHGAIGFCLRLFPQGFRQWIDQAICVWRYHRIDWLLLWTGYQGRH